MKIIDKIFLSSIVNKSTPFRNDLIKALIKNDFTAKTYENIDRENTAEKGLGGQDECLHMIKGFNALIGILDLDPGTNYLGSELYNHKQLLPNSLPEKITVTMAEILYAKYVLKIPTLIMAMPGLMNRIQYGGNTLRVIGNFISFLNKEKNNYLEREILSVDHAMSKVNGLGWCPLNRMKLLGNSLSGKKWNGLDYFDNSEITIRNNLYPNLDALRQLIKDECRVEKRLLRLSWLINHLNKFSKHTLDQKEIEFIEEYIHRYSGIYRHNKDQRKKVMDENRANYLLLRLPFGEDKVFYGYMHSRNGRVPKKLNWPSDAYRWPAQARVEFILYSLQMEIILPERLNAIADFNASSDHVPANNGFTAHYSRKPVTVGCQNAANVRLQRDNGVRGINVSLEMKSMLYLTYTGTRYCLIGVHVKGNQDVNEEKVLSYFAESYNTSEEDLKLVNGDNLLNYLDKIDSPEPKKNAPKTFTKLSRYGAQELIALFASSINPVSIFMSVRYKYEYLLTKNIKIGFDCLMLWDNSLLKEIEVYNNAGSPTWGMRFNPQEMYDHIQKNTYSLEQDFEKKDLKIKYKMTQGEFSKPKRT